MKLFLEQMNALSSITIILIIRFLDLNLKVLKNKSLLMFSFYEQEEKPYPLSLQSMNGIDQLQINWVMWYIL